MAIVEYLGGLPRRDVALSITATVQGGTVRLKRGGLIGGWLCQRFHPRTAFAAIGVGLAVVTCAMAVCPPTVTMYVVWNLIYGRGDRPALHRRKEIACKHGRAGIDREKKQHGLVVAQGIAWPRERALLVWPEPCLDQPVHVNEPLEGAR